MPKEFENEVKKDEEIVPTTALENNAAYIQGTNVISAVKGPVFRDSQIGGRTVVPRNSSIIQETIDKLHKEGGGTVFLQNGTYKLDTDITMYSNIYLKGESRDLTILDFQNNAYGVLAQGSDAYSTGTISTSNLLSNLKAYYKLDESSGNAVDSSGNGNTLTNNNTVTYSAGKINNGANFVRTSSQYLSITDAAQSGLDITGDLSISFWMKPSTVAPPNTYFMLVDKFGNGSQLSYSVRQNNANIYFSISDNGTTEHNVSGTSNNLQANVWQHIVVTYSAAAHLATFYYNGSSVGTADTVATSIFNGTANFELGNGVDNTTYIYDGSLDEVGVWARTLTPTEVSELYNSGSGVQHSFIQNRKYITGSGTTFTSSMVGQDILLNGIWYKIADYVSATSIITELPYSGATLSGATYTIATTISDAHVENITITNALNAIDVQYAKDFFVVDNIYTTSVIGLKIQTSANMSIIQPRSIACNEGFNLSAVSLANFDECGALSILAGNGMTLANCSNIAIGNLYLSGNYGDGISLTSCEDISIAGTIKSNGSNGIELVSGNNNITINNSSIEDNTSDGIKFTATSDNCFVSTSSIARNGGYGLNIAAATCDNNIILGNNFASNTSGATSDSGTATKIRSNIGVADN